VDSRYLKAVPGGTQLMLAIRPRASRSRVIGVFGDRLKVQIAAPPVDGKANEALCDFLAERFGVPRSRVMIAAGETGTKKTVIVLGVDTQVAARCLAVLA
jgi:uncharacterized protein (TIGR00251 family)